MKTQLTPLTQDEFFKFTLHFCTKTVIMKNALLKKYFAPIMFCVQNNGSVILGVFVLIILIASL